VRATIQPFVHLDGATVAARHVQDRQLPAIEHPVDYPAGKRPPVAAALRVGMRADAAHFATVADPHPLARHRQQPAVIANADEASELDRAQAKRPGLRELDQNQHVGDVGFTERANVDVAFRQRSSLVADHLRDWHFDQRFPVRGQGRHARADGPHVIADLDQRLQRGDIRRTGIWKPRNRRNVGRIAARGVTSQREMRMARRETRPDGIVEQALGIGGGHVSKLDESADPEV
jgi:hypothetical protein